MENKKIELGKEYGFAGYRWVPVEINEECQEAVMQSLGVTAGPWPGYSMSQFGNGDYYTQDISGKDIGDYDEKTRALMKQIKPVSLIDSLYLPSFEDIDDNTIWKAALAKAASNHNLFESLYTIAWLGTVNGSSGAWYVNWNKYVGRNGGQYVSYVVAPAFNLDLSKIEIVGDKIIKKAQPAPSLFEHDDNCQEHQLLGKTYKLAGYDWTVCEVDKEHHIAVIQSHGVTSGAWPGYTMPQFGNGNYYSKSIDGEDISAYDNKMKELYDTIKDAENTSASYGKGLYLISMEKAGFAKWCKSGFGNYCQTLKKAASHGSSFGASVNVAWTGTYYGNSGDAWVVNSNGDTYGNYQSGSFVVAPAFNLDLSKVEIMGDEIVIAGTKLCVAEESIQKASKDSKQMWIIATCDSDGEGIWMDKIEATEDQIKNKMVDMVANLRGEDPDAYENGTEWPDEVQTNGTLFANKDSLYACANFVHSHVDISAIRLDDIPEINQ